MAFASASSSFEQMIEFVSEVYCINILIHTESTLLWFSAKIANGKIMNHVLVSKGIWPLMINHFVRLK